MRAQCYEAWIIYSAPAGLGAPCCGGADVPPRTLSPPSPPPFPPFSPSLSDFLTLCYAYVGGPGEVVTAQDGKTVHPSWLHGTCCLPSLLIDGALLRLCKQATLQFVVLKPILAGLTLLMEHFEWARLALCFWFPRSHLRGGFV